MTKGKLARLRTQWGAGFRRKMQLSSSPESKSRKQVELKPGKRAQIGRITKVSRH